MSGVYFLLHPTHFYILIKRYKQKIHSWYEGDPGFWTTSKSIVFEMKFLILFKKFTQLFLQFFIQFIVIYETGFLVFFLVTSKVACYLQCKSENLSWAFPIRGQAMYLTRNQIYALFNRGLFGLFLGVYSYLL